MTHPITVRFWTWHVEGYVKLTLREGVPLHWSDRGPTEDGWSMRGESWELEDGVVLNTEVTDGRDCDGRMSTYGRYACPASDLNGYFLDDDQQNPDKIRTPNWERVSGRQRDYSAEAMDY